MQGLGFGTLKDFLNLPKNDAELDAFARKNKTLGPDYDYSMIGKTDERGHGSDLGKLPNHPTFSNQSAYAKDGSPGRWLKARDGSDYFEPSPEQFKKFGREFYDQYSRDTGDKINIPVPEEPGLVDVSGMSAIPVNSAFSGLRGIQLTKGKDLARKISWGKEMAKNKADAKRFASGLVLSAENIDSIGNAGN